MTHAEAAHAKDVSLACLVACDSVGGIIAQDAYLTSQPSLLDQQCGLQQSYKTANIALREIKMGM